MFYIRLKTLDLPGRNGYTFANSFFQLNTFPDALLFEIMDLTPENIFGLLRSTEDFPVDLDDAWQWIGWPKKQHAKDVLLNNFLEGMDFLRKGVKSPSGGRPSEWIVLTVDCFKSLGMMAGTVKGRQVRRYFLECESRLKELLNRQKAENSHRVIKAVVQDKPDLWEKRFEDEFFDEAYRITGWQRSEKGHPPCMGTFINETVYDYFPDGVPERLRQVNPKNENGNRLRKHHQHLSPTLGLPILSSQKAATIAVMRLSPANNRKRFKQNMAKACGTQFQVELPFMDDLNQLGEAS